jgi:DNA-binding NarL/FixJ family response regulator
MVLTSFGSDALLLAALRAGAAGCLLKDSGPEELVEAVRRLAAGATVLAPAVTRHLVPALSSQTAVAARLAADDQALLAELARGRTDAEIGARTGISEATVASGVTAVLERLGVAGRAEAAVVAVASGLVDLGSTDG